MLVAPADRLSACIDWRAHLKNRSTKHIANKRETPCVISSTFSWKSETLPSQRFRQAPWTSWLGRNLNQNVFPLWQRLHFWRMVSESCERLLALSTFPICHSIPCLKRATMTSPLTTQLRAERLRLRSGIRSEVLP